MRRENVSRVPIDPATIGKGLVHVLNVKGENVAPDNVDQSTIIPVIDVNFDGFSRLNNDEALLYCAETTGISLSGLQTFTVSVINYCVNDGSGRPQIVIPNDHNFYLWGIKIYMQMNAGGAAAMNGLWASMELVLRIPHPDGTTIYACKWAATFLCRTGVLLYTAGYENIPLIDRDTLYVIPRGSELQFTIWTQAGGNFPGAPNTCKLYYQIVGQSFITGAQPPDLI